MLPGVELARRRRLHYRGDAVGGEHHGHHQQLQLGAAAQAVTGVVGPALAARIRLEEKLRGTTTSPSSSHAPSRWGRQMRERDGRATSRQQNIQQEQQQQGQQVLAASTELRLPCPRTTKTSCRAEMRRTLSKADLCAVCLDEVQERQQRVTQLPCSHKYHSDCVLPWLAIQPDCPCCRTLVPSVDSLS